MTEAGNTVALLWNVSSGWTSSEETLETIRSILVSHGSTLDVTELKEGMDIGECVEAAIRAGAELVVAAGGDGTVNAVASALLYRPVALGIIPAGTLNHLARDLNLPIDEQKAAVALTSARVVSIDAATVNGRTFVNNSVLGFFPYYRHLRERLERRWFGSSKLGRFAAVVAGLCAALWRLPRLTVRYSTRRTEAQPAHPVRSGRQQ